MLKELLVSILGALLRGALIAACLLLALLAWDLSTCESRGGEVFRVPVLGGSVPLCMQEVKEAQ